MKLILLLAIGASLPLLSQQLSIQPSDSGIELSWPRNFPPSSGVPAILESRIFSSPDLHNWVEETTLELDDSTGEGISSFTLAPGEMTRFFRLEQNLKYAHRADTSAPPAAYQLQFSNAMEGFRSASSPEDPGCLPAITWDPTEANYWTEFNTTPAEHNAALAQNDPERRRTDFSLNEAETIKFEKNGFVVSPRIDLIDGENFGGFPTPVDYYYKLWADDLPVFISSDSVLDAWHTTFLGMLEEMEELILYPLLRDLIEDLSGLSEISASWEIDDSPGADHVRQAIADLNLYLGTAHLLLKGYDDSPPSADQSSPTHWFQAARAHEAVMKTDLYGDAQRFEDMTLFIPRGHYANSQVLTAYFQGFLWLSRAQFQMGYGDATPQSDRELRAAILLALQVRDQNLMPRWGELESFLQSLAGQSDAMTVAEMVALLESLSLDDAADIASDANLATIRAALIATNYGAQEIDGGTIDPGCNPSDFVLPRALSLFGQRWTPDAWTFQNVVFPKVKENDTSIARRIPSGLDVAYATLGNDTALPILADRMTSQEGFPFRDGYNYQENLDSVRSVLDSQESEFWTEHTYGSWLFALRGLSKPVPSSAPETFRTTAWKRRVMSTQLMSWTQLRHDTLLYAEQSFTPPVICEFPDGYVDPYPELWKRLSEMALQYRDLLAPLTLSGQFFVERRDPWNEASDSLRHWNSLVGYTPQAEVAGIVVERGSRIEAITTHLENFSNRCLTLEAIARQQLAGLPHTAEMHEFIKDTVETFSIDGCVGYRKYTGWFPHLYFETIFSNPDDHPSALWNPVVVDVHTDSVSDCHSNPGAILHEGTGHAQFILVAVKHADGTSCVYGGPTMSHFEFLEDRNTRLNDTQWKRRLEAGNAPAPADWKLDFLVPEPE